MGSPAPPILLQLPQELQNDIYSLLEADDIKNLRVTCSAFHEALPLHFDRVFISANSLNIDVFNAIASHETFQYEEDGNDPEDAVAENVCPFWFKKGRYDYGDPSPYVYPDVYLGIEESWAYYKRLLDDQRRVLSSNADIEAFKYGLKRFTSLKRVTVTPATHGRLWQPLYRIPMIRAFPPGFDYPLPQAWPSFDDEKLIDALPWVSEDGNDPYQEIYGAECTAEAYRAKWRGFRLITRALVECEDHTITELIIGGNEIQSGLNCRIYLIKGPPNHWPHLRHFGISHMLVDLDDFIDLLATLPSSLRSIELIHVALGTPEQGYDDLLRAMRDILEWSSRTAQERPKVHMVVSALHDHVQGEGKFVEVDDVVHSYLYENGDNPFEDDKYVIWPGQGGVQRDIFNPNYVAPY
ncbi:hypothetical protein FOWG_11784 [Fusarium oxysporum f. sp. lycopersici MN25]|nr:hypothetical protein FOWG_11784 [Fusarium oxysporum f. sp. lycopersici MN25]